MSRPDLTVALTAHSETVVAGPTMHSAAAAVSAAEAAGWTVERLIGFDTCSNACRAFMTQPEFAAWTTADFEHRDQGRTRNALAKMARGKWLAFLDGDDLVSENWLVEALSMLAEAEAAGARVIVHPELNWVFDAGSWVFTKPAQDDPLFSPLCLGVFNFWDALCAAPREAWLEHPYADRAVKEGFAYEDWQWNIETMEGGWKHLVARDTIIFKRRRDSSQTHDSRRHAVTIRTVEGAAIDRIADLGADNGADNGGAIEEAETT